MPFLDLSLSKVSQCKNLKDIAPVKEQTILMSGLEILHKGALKGHRLERNPQGALALEFYFADTNTEAEAVVKVTEAEPHGLLNSECSVCRAQKGAQACKHEWGAGILLWWAYAQDSSFLRRLPGPITFFCRDFQELVFEEKPGARSEIAVVAEKNVKLESMSLVFDELPLRGSANLAEVLPAWDGKYELRGVPYVEDNRNSYLWDMPQVFRKPLSIDSVFYWSDLKKQNQLAAMVRYNFSDGTQISSREILRHSYRELVSKELLPTSIRSALAGPVWPLVQRQEDTFISRDMSEIEEVIQALLVRLQQKNQSAGLKLFLQTEVNPEGALEVQEIEMDVAESFHWDVQFEGDSTVLTKISLQPNNPEKKYIFFQTFALDLDSKSLVAFSWYREQELIRQFFVKTLGLPAPDGFAPFSIEGTEETGTFLKLLRAHSIPVRIRGGSHLFGRRSSFTQIQFKNTGGFRVEHVYERDDKPSVHQSGWTLPAILLMKTLSQGVGSLVQGDVRSVVARTGSKRDWDLKLLKHLGIPQYLALEALSLYFTERLTDGSVCSRENLVVALYNNLRSLLLSNEGTVLDKSLSLTELCSRPALSCLESFVAQIFKMITETHSVFSPEGELIYAGVVERDFQLIYEILKQLASATQGASFRKSRSSFLSKIWDGSLEGDALLRRDDFFLPSAGREPLPVSQTLVLLHPMKGSGFRLLLNGQALVELGQDEFKVDFQIVSNLEDKMLNWFELNPQFFLQGESIDPAALKGFGGGGGILEYNGQYFIVPQTQIPSMRRLENFWLKLQQGKNQAGKRTWSDKVYQLPKSQTLELLALRASGHALQGDSEWKKLCEFYDSLSNHRKNIDVPTSVIGNLKVYQHEGFQWLYDLYNLKLGALLADDMGLGKTLQALTFLEFLRTRGELGQVLIVVPSSLVYNWESEVAKFTPQIPLQIFTTKESDRIGAKLESKVPLVVITTYGLLMENDKFLSQYNWNILLFDEAQNLKNITTKRTSAARMLSARFKICMTGTPMENHFGEYFSLLDLIVPGCLGKYEDFRRHYVNTDVVLVEDVEDLKLRTKPLLLRRTKKEILDQLPDKQETKVSIAFEEKQKQIYRDIALAYNEKVKESMRESGEAQVQLQMLTALLRLRQACSDPGALPAVSYDRVPPKLEALFDSLKEIIGSGESALVFTQFLQTLERTEKILKEAGIPVFVLHGAIPTGQRQKILRAFNEHPGGAVLVMTLKTGGVGLNLTKASYVFHLEPWWNPSVENQATDRAHRLGQKKAVQVFRYIMHESLEEKMEQLKERKSKKFLSLFSDTESAKEIGTGSSALSKEDFDFLLGIK